MDYNPPDSHFAKSNHAHVDMDALQQQQKQLFQSYEPQNYLGNDGMNFQQQIAAPGAFTQVIVQDNHGGSQASYQLPRQEGYVPPHQFGGHAEQRLTPQVQRALMMRQKDYEEVYRIDEKFDSGLYACLSWFFLLSMLDGIAVLIFLGPLHDLFFAQGCLQAFSGALIVNGMRRKSAWKVILASFLGVGGSIVGMVAFAFALQGGHFDVSPRKEGSIRLWAILNFIINCPFIYFFLGQKLSSVLIRRDGLVGGRQDLDEIK